MCKRRTYSPAAHFAGDHAYEGPTMSLDETYDRPAARRCRHVPWWTLWLLWPLLAGLKWLVPLWLGAISALAGAFSASGGLIAALVLIAAGLLLIMRHETEHKDYNA